MGLPDANVFVEKYIALMRANPRFPSISASHFSPTELASLTHHGFLTSTSATTLRESLLHRSRSNLGTTTSLSATAASQAASGSLAATGGSGAIHSSGGSGGGAFARPTRTEQGGLVSFSLPNMGAYLKLLSTARTHLMTLLNRSSKHHESTKDLLNECWDGGIASDDGATAAKKARGEFVGVLPGRTKKWKQFHGLEFCWVLEECLGSGTLECFQTGSVGVGVRATT